MESKVTRYSAAAVVILALAVVLLGPFGPSQNGSVVWADVIENVGQMRTVIMKQEYVFREKGDEDPTLAADSMRYVSEKYGVVEYLFDDAGARTHEVYWLKETCRFLIVAHAEKLYLELTLPEESFDLVGGMLTPRRLVEYFTSGQYTELGPTDRDGSTVEGFETADRGVLFPIPEPLRSLYPVKDIVGRMWIDVESSLPVSVDAEYETGRGLLTGLKKLEGEYRACDFRWNAEIPDEVFEPNIPADYAPIGLESIAKEAPAWIGIGTLPVLGFVIHRRRHRRRARCLQPPGDYTRDA